MYRRGGASPPPLPSKQAQPAPPPQDLAAAPPKETASSPWDRKSHARSLRGNNLTVGGVAIPLGHIRLLKARFEKYLSRPARKGAQKRAARYREAIAEILATVALLCRRTDLYSAFKLLPTASSYPGDANLCGSLANPSTWPCSPKRTSTA